MVTENPAVQFFAGRPDGSAVAAEVSRVVSSLGPHDVRISRSQVAFRRRTGFAYLWRPGQYVASDRELDELEAEGRVVFRYEGVNPNGSRRGIAGITNERGNVVGLMPHPEHAVEPGFGPDSDAGPRTGTDGLRFFTSVLSALVHA